MSIKQILIILQDNSSLTRFYLDASFQGVKMLFVLAFNNTTANFVGNLINNTNNRVETNSNRKYFLPRENITNYNVLIGSRNFHDEPINDQIKNYDEIRNIASFIITYKWLNTAK